MQLSNAQARYQALSALHVQRELRAPFDGIVLRPQKSEAAGSTAAPPQPGLRVTQGMPLYELVHLERIKTVARVEEADLRQLSEGMPVQITGDGFDGITLQGRIAVIGVQGVVGMSGSGTTYEVTAAVDPLTPEQRRRVRLGMSARMAVVTYRTDGGLALPAEALRDDGEGRSVVVYRADSDEAPQQVSVTTGRAVPQGVEVFGLKPGYVELPASN
jgi:multidrug efflux pump subunit AcrA (membrane-fusion protein)